MAARFGIPRFHSRSSNPVDGPGGTVEMDAGHSMLPGTVVWNTTTGGLFVCTESGAGGVSFVELERLASRDVADGYCPLDGDALVPLGNLPVIGYPQFVAQTVRRVTDVGLTGDTVLHDVQSAMTVSSGTAYRFKFLTVFQTNAVTEGIGLALSVPAHTVFIAESRIPTGAGGVGTHTYDGAHKSSGDVVASAAVQIAAQDFLAITEGIIVPSANGSVTLRAKCNVATDNITVRTGSFGELWPLP